MSKRKNPFVSKKKVKRRRESKVFETKRQQLLAESDRGSYYNQENNFPDLKKSASLRKIAENSCKPTKCEDLQRPSLILVDGKELEDGLAASVACKHCGEAVELLEKTTSRQGLGTFLTIQCHNDCHNFSFPTSKKQGRIFEINRLASLGMRVIGRGHSSAERLFSILGLPLPVSHKPWAEHTKIIEEKCRELCEKDMQEATWELKKELVKEGIVESCTDKELKDKVIDTGVSIDGSWCSRGWSATNACVAAISTQSGKVLDVVHLSSSCAQCQKAEVKRERGEISKVDYLGWFLEHEPNCFLNHEGTSSSMEAAGALMLYRRSIERRKLRYIPFVGDGDSKAYTDVCKAQPYGPAVFIPKEECISHWKNAPASILWK